MLLTFSKQQFVDRIKSGVKIHTIREDKHNRWKPGMKIQFWFGNPRNTRSKNKPYHFANGECEYVDDITIMKGVGEIGVFIIPEKSHALDIYDCDKFSELLAIGDGFDNPDEMFSWFFSGGIWTFGGKLVWFKVTEILQ